MKNLKMTTAAIITAGILALITACNMNADTHEHTFKTEWSSDETNHWHAASCEHKDEVKDKAAHTFGDWTVTLEATEDAEGKKERECSVCHYKETETIAKLEHTHKFATAYSSDATNHWYAATCEHKDEVKDKAEHTFGEWKVTTQPTEEAEGAKERVCSACGYKTTAAVAKLDHVHAKGTHHDAVASTCVKKGNVKYYDCVKATCEVKLDEDGKPLATIESELDPSNHTGTATTWTKTATTHKETYDCCKAVKTAEADHSFSEWIVKTAATCTTDGSKERICKVCSYTETAVIEKTGHAWDSGTVTTKAVCENHDGEKTYNCTACSETKKETIAKAAAHTWGNGTITLKPKCGVSDGERTYTCAVCGETKKETVTRPDDHSWDKGVLTKMDTDNPEKVFTCTVCDGTYSYPMKKMTVTEFIKKIKEINSTNSVKKITAEERTEPGITQTDSETVNVWRIVLTGAFSSSFPSTLETCNLTGVDTSNVTSMKYMFENCTNLTSVNLSSFDTSNVTSMSSMFRFCEKLELLDLSNFDTSNVTNMSNMFRNCDKLASLDLSSFDTSNVTNMSSMFEGCRELTSLDLSSFDTGNVTDMTTMFQLCLKLTSLNVSNFDTGKVTSMKYMFQNCQSLKSLDLSSFDTSNVTNMYRMFSACGDLETLNISKFDTRKVTDMDYMFDSCRKLTSLDLSSFNTSSVTNYSNMFNSCAVTTIKYNSSIFKPDMVVYRNTITWIDVAQ